MVERLAYDAFGKRRQSLGWAEDPTDLLLAAIHSVKRGFSGHEHLDHLGLIHMNGRVYDPVLGRFLSADPYVQFPQSTQGLNRYTYGANNPLSYTDPSGHFLSAIAGALSAIAAFVAEYAVYIAVAAVATAVGDGSIAAMAIASIPGAQGLGVLVQGFAAGLVGSEGDLQAAFMGAWGAGAFSGVGTLVAEAAQGVGAYAAGMASSVAHGVVGGVSQELLGGRFGDGFLGAAAATAMAPAIRGWDNPTMRMGTAAVVGGTAAELGGGKFANGARTFGFLRLFRELPGYYRQKVGYDPDIGPGGAAVEKGPLGDPVDGANNIGTQEVWKFDSNGQRVVGFFEEGGPVSRFANQIPGINAVSGLHDKMQISMGNSIWRDVLNVPGMPVAAGVTYGSFIGQALNAAPANLYVPINVGRDRRRDEDRFIWAPAGGF